MPTRICLGCSRRFQSYGGDSRCERCRGRLKARRNAEARLNARVVAEARIAGAVCPACGRPETRKDPFAADHIIPPDRGGSTLDRSNLRAIHRSCNTRKRNR